MDAIERLIDREESRASINGRVDDEAVAAAIQYRDDRATVTRLTEENKRYREALDTIRYRDNGNGHAAHLACIRIAARALDGNPPAALVKGEACV